MELFKYLDDETVNVFENHPFKDNITELRFKVGQPAQFLINGNLKPVSHKLIGKTQIEDMLYQMCKKSINVYEDEISNGYITLNDGVRVGIGGEYFYSNELNKYILKQIQSVNIRIAKDIKSFINQEKLFALDPLNTLIIGPPHSGKTSLLKLYSKILSEKYRVIICDERKELFSERINCDVIRGIKKCDAIHMAVRNLNPQIVICDEIGYQHESEAILSAVNTGVKFICSAHGDNYKNIIKRPNIKILTDNKIFERLVLIKQNKDKFYIEDVTDV